MGAGIIREGSCLLSTNNLSEAALNKADPLGAEEEKWGRECYGAGKTDYKKIKINIFHIKEGKALSFLSFDILPILFTKIIYYKTPYSLWLLHGTIKIVPSPCQKQPAKKLNLNMLPSFHESITEL